MTGQSLLPLFLIACAAGYIVARPGGDSGRPLWRAGIGGPAAIILVGTLIAAAEAGSAAARYVALFAIICASAATVILIGVMERRWPHRERTADEEDGT